MNRLFVFAIAIVTAAFALPATASAASISCDIRSVKRGGATVVEGFVSASAGTNGSYRISVSAGSGDSDQSGEFEGSGTRVTLGSVPVAGSGAYSAEITIKVKGIAQCSSRTSGRS